MSTENEPYPIHEAIHVIKGETVYKSKKWWKAVLLVNSFGHNKVMIYLWQYVEVKKRVADPSAQGGFKWVGTGTFKWKRQQHMGFTNPDDYNKSTEIADRYMGEL